MCPSPQSMRGATEARDLVDSVSGGTSAIGAKTSSSGSQPNSNKRRAAVAHIQHRPGRRRPWQVRYRDPAGRERARSFYKKADADRFAAAVETDILRGEWTDPRLSRTSIAEWAERWDKDARVVEVVLQQSRRIVRQIGPVLISRSIDYDSLASPNLR